MPATSPRMTLTLPPNVYEVVGRMARIQKRPKAAVIRDFLEMAAPALGEIVEALEAVEHAQEQARHDLAGSLEAVQDDLQPHLQGILGHLSALTQMGAPEGSGGAEVVPERDPARSVSEDGKPAPDASSPTPGSNRGVRSVLSGSNHGI